MIEALDIFKAKVLTSFVSFNCSLPFPTEDIKVWFDRTMWYFKEFLFFLVGGQGSRYSLTKEG